MQDDPPPEEPRQITQGLLDALVLTPVGGPGEAPKRRSSSTSECENYGRPCQPSGYWCDWHPEHSADDRPTGKRCGEPATHRVFWLDGTYRYSHSCLAHLVLDADAPPYRIEKLEVADA